MKKIPARLKKSLLFAAGSLALLLVVLLIAISPLTKWMIERYDRDLIGREVTLARAFVNPFTGRINLHNLTIFEENGDSVFLTAKNVGANIALFKLFSRTVELSDLRLEQPWVRLIQRHDTLNLSDIIQRFKRTPGESKKSSWRFSWLNTHITNAEIHYVEQIIPINYFIKDVMIQSAGMPWGSDTLNAKFDFTDGRDQGRCQGNFTINVTNLHYRFDVITRDYDLEIIRQYIWELINYGMFRARLDANFTAIGNFNSKDSITVKGRMALRDFHLGETKEEDYLSFKEMVLGIQELSPVHRKFLFDSVLLSYPYLKYERYDSLDNLEAMFGKKGKNISDVTGQDRFNLVIEIARYIKILSRNFFQSDYKIGTLRLHDGTVRFSDYSRFEKFSIGATPLTISADSVNNNHKNVVVNFKSGITPYGNATMVAQINPKDSADFDLDYAVEKVPVTAFNPYLISASSYPLDRGTIELHGSWKVRKGNISSTNHVVVIDPRVTKRMKNHDTKWIPLPLVMSFIRERGNVIDYEIPISGNLKHPNFHLWDVVFDLLKNIFIKPPTTPYREEVKQIETAIEKSLTVKWQMRQHVLLAHEKKFIQHISDFLKDHPTASLNVQPITYALKEKEYILFFEAKKKYFLLARGKRLADFNEADSMEVNKMSIKEAAFVKYIGRNLSDTVMFTLQERCLNFVGSNLVNTRFQMLVQRRESAFRTAFIESGTNDRVHIATSHYNIPYDGFSYFQLNYPGEIPDALRKAYQHMNELNEEAPRKKYLKERKSEAAIKRRAGK